MLNFYDLHRHGSATKLRIKLKVQWGNCTDSLAIRIYLIMGWYPVNLVLAVCTFLYISIFPSLYIFFYGLKPSSHWFCQFHSLLLPRQCLTSPHPPGAARARTFLGIIRFEPTAFMPPYHQRRIVPFAKSSGCLSSQTWLDCCTI